MTTHMLKRREFLAALGAVPLAPSLLHLATLLREPGAGKRSLIVLWMDGGMSHLDTFDTKPEAKSDIRGELGSRRCKLDGVFVSEHLPHLADVLDRTSLIRSMTSGEGNHDRGSHYMLTGHRPSPVLVYPSMGSVLGLGAPLGPLPDYVAIPDSPPYGKQGFLPATRLPFEVGANPARPDFRVENLAPAPDRRRAQELLELVDGLDTDRTSAAERARDRFLAQARAMSEDPRARDAFAFRKERPEDRARYGRHEFGQSCLLARRLVESGVRVVLVRYRSWDHHVRIDRGLTYGFPPKLQAIDSGVTALIEDIDRRELGDRVTVVLASEFGRTPRLNPAGGRDHWPRAYSVLLFGAGIRRGVVHGATDANGEEPSADPVSPADLHATLLTALRVPLDGVLRTNDGRPIPVVERGAEPVNEVLVT